MKKLLISSVVSGLTVFGLASPVMAAGTASLSLSPASASRTVGTSLSVGVYENGDAVNVVTANLTYDASKLTCTGVVGGSALPNQVTGSCGGGSVSISRYAAPSTTVSGSQLVATINFSAVAAGTTTITFASNSIIASNGNNIWNGVTTGGTYTITAPVVITPPTNPTPPTTPTTPPAQTGSTTPPPGSTTSTSVNGTKVTTVKNADGSTTTTSVAKNGDTTIVTKTADGQVVVKKISANDSRKKHRWYQFGSVDGNGPLTAARYGTVGLAAASAIAGLVYLAMRRRDLLFGKPKQAGKAMVGGVKTAPRAVATAVKPLPSKVKKLAKRG